MFRTRISRQRELNGTAFFWNNVAATRNTPPIFISDMNGFRISEDTPPGTTVYNLTASDAETDVYYGIDKTDIFYADPVTGEVSLVRPLDYENAPILNFVTVVEDQPVNGSQMNTVSRPVAIYVIDTNDMVPYFLEPSPVEAAIALNAPPMSSVAVLKAVDPDTVGSPLTVSCKGTYLIGDRDPCDYFHILVNYTDGASNSISAELLLLSQAKDFYALGVREIEMTLNVSDGVHSSDATVRIALEDVGNDGALRYTHPPAASPSSPPSVPISTSNQAMFPMPPPFMGDRRSAAGDPSLHQLFEPDAKIVENGPVSSAPLPFRRLSPVLNATIPDDAEDDQLVLTAQVADPGTEDRLSYAIIGPWAKYFRPVVRQSPFVEIRTALPNPGSRIGEPRVWQQLPDNFALILRSTDRNGTGLFTDAPVAVRVVKMEKHAPVFADEPHFARLQEGGFELVPPLVLEAYDEDNSLLAFSLDDPTGVFHIDPRTGIVYVRHPEDVTIANLGRRLQMIVSVSDGVHEPARVNVTVEIAPADGKGHNRPPTFRTPADDFVVPAGAGEGFVVGNVIAEDPEGAGVRYYLTGGGEGSFLLNQDTGEIAFAGQRVVNNRTFAVTVIASDQQRPPAFASSNLRIVAIGLNSVEPKFVDLVHSALVPENTPVGTELAQLRVVDPDANGQLSHSVGRAVGFDAQGYPALTSADGTDLSAYFALRDESVVLRKSLYDIGLSVFHIHVSVNDMLHPLEQAASALLVLNVVPVTKSRVKTLEFVGIPGARPNESVQAEVTVPSELKASGFVYQFHVAEKSSAGRTAMKPLPVVFTIRSGDEFFAIDESTGVVVAKQPLERAPQRSLVLVDATDSRSGQTVTARLTVEVGQGVRHVVTMETSQASVVISEDAKPGSVVMRANATSNSDSAIQYSLTGPDAVWFSVDSEGVVTLVSPVDRENSDLLTFIVMAALLAENGSIIASSTTAVAVSVQDKNDNKPTFSNSTFAGIALEDISSNSYIMNIRAYDPDAGENGTVIYSLDNLPEEIKGYLIIDPMDGTIVNSGSLLGLAGVYNFTVVARDGGGMTSTAPVILTVRHVSSCHPTWSKPTENSTMLEIAENLPPGQLVGTVHAVTQGQKCKVKYTFLDPSTGQAASFTTEFNLDPNSGRITTRVTLDREKRARYTLTVTAKDVEIINAFAIQKVIEVAITDTSDSEPVFQYQPNAPGDCNSTSSLFLDCLADQVPQSYNLSVFENEPSGTVLGVLVAYDADEGDNAKIYYHLAGGPDASRFDLDLENGTLSTKQPFDYETVQEMQLIVVATNEPRLSANKRAALLANASALNVLRIVVVVMDRNDLPAVFDKRVYLAALFNETMPDNLVTTVHAVDLDTVGAGIYYRLQRTVYHYKGSVIAERNMVWVDPIHGEVRTSREIGEYSHGYFEVIVDSSNAQNYTTALNDTTSVKIWIYTAEQLVRIVTRDTPLNVTEHAGELVQELGDAIGADVILQRVEYHRDSLGIITNDKVDLLAVFIDRSTAEIMDISKVLAVVDRHGLLLAAATKPNLAVAQILPAYGVKADTSARLSAAAIAMIVFGSVMFVGLLGVLLLLCHFRYKVVKDMKAVVVRKPEPVKIQRTMYIPTRQIKENPLWNDVDQKPYEEQELSIPVPPSDDSASTASPVPSLPAPTLNYGYSDAANITPSYARIQKQQPAPASSPLSNSSENYYQTLHME